MLSDDTIQLILDQDSYKLSELDANDIDLTDNPSYDNLQIKLDEISSLLDNLNDK